MVTKLLIITFFILNLIICQEGGFLRNLEGQCNVSLKKTTISGISSGGYMAVQLQVSNSNFFSGAVIIAAGPYWNAKGSEEFGQKACKTKPELIDINELVEYTKQAEKEGKIDNLSNLQDQPISLIYMENDSTVVPEVTLKLQQQYERFGAQPVTYNVPHCEHCYPTDHFGNIDSLYQGSPYMNICGFNTAFHTFEYLYDFKNLHSRTKQQHYNLFTFDQRPYLAEDSGMGDKGYIYIPHRCQIENQNNNSEPCYVHVALHGCRQSTDHIGSTFARNTFLNQLGESNGVIILYPQTKVSRKNINACWDYWGYSGQDYALKSGKQNTSIMNMLQALGKISSTAQQIQEDL